MELVSADFKDNKLTLYVRGRIDASKAQDVDTLISGFRTEYPTDDIMLDFDELEYISSSGLRVILRLRKETPKLRIVNASSEVYEILECTGFTEIVPVAKAFRKLSVDGCKAIGYGAKGTVYRYDEDTIVKVYKNADSLPDIQRERDLARRAFVLGVPTAIPYDTVRVGDSYGSVFELLSAKSYSQLLAEEPENIERYVGDFANLLRDIHGTQVSADEMPDAKIIARKWLSASAPYLSDEDNAKLEALLNALPDTLNMLHCDYHTNNVMMQNGEIILIDMDTLSHGHPVIELANIYITYVGFLEFDPEDVEKFLGFGRDEANKVWEIFLPVYLNSEDKAYIESVEKKAKLLSYTRCIRHAVRHSKDPEHIQAVASASAKAIHQLLQEIDTLEF